MVSYFAVVPKRPGCIDIFFSLLEFALGELNPAERIPVGDQRWDQREITLGQAIERHIAQRGSGSGYRRLGVLLSTIEMRIFQRELVSNVVPNQRYRGQLHRMVKGCQRLVI